MLTVNVNCDSSNNYDNINNVEVNAIWNLFGFEDSLVSVAKIVDFLITISPERDHFCYVQYERFHTGGCAIVFTEITSNEMKYFQICVPSKSILPQLFASSLDYVSSKQSPKKWDHDIQPSDKFLRFALFFFSNKLFVLATKKVFWGSLRVNAQQVWITSGICYWPNHDRWSTFVDRIILSCNIYNVYTLTWSVFL